jgi:hypothetical protein
MVMALPPVESLQLEMGETARANLQFPANGVTHRVEAADLSLAGEIANRHCAAASPAATHHGFRQKRAHMLYMELWA